MSVSAADATPPNREDLVEHLFRANSKSLALAFAVLHLALLQEAWGDRRAFASVLACLPAALFFNFPFLQGLQRFMGLGLSRIAILRLAGNVAFVTAMGAWTHWQFAIWIYAAFYVLVGGMLGLAYARRRTAVFWVLLGGGALALGASPFKLVLTAVASTAAFLLMDRLSNALSGLVQQSEARRIELEAAHAEYKALHERAVQQEKLAGLGMLAAGVAHEINNPMAYVTSNVSSLLEDLQRERKALSPTLREYADDVLPATLDGIQRVNSIVADLRRFARGDHDELVEYDLNDEIRAAVRLAQSRLKNRCEVRLSLGDLPQLVGHPRQIAQVLVNLLVNASQAIQERGSIEIASRETLDGALFSVRDDGCGMTEEVRRHLFQPFFTTKPLGEGTGLGLSVVHGIVSDHGGHIQVESAPGKGTCFTVALPSSPPESLDARPPTGTWRIDALMAANGGPR